MSDDGIASEDARDGAGVDEIFADTRLLCEFESRNDAESLAGLRSGRGGACVFGDGGSERDIVNVVAFLGQNSVREIVDFRKVMR